MKKTLTFLILLLIMLSASAYDFQATFTTSQGYTKRLCFNITGNNTVEVTWQRVPTSDNPARYIRDSYFGKEIPATVQHNGITYTVTAIGDSAFTNCGYLYGFNNVLIPNTVTRIGKYAFSGCTETYYLTIPSSVSVIDTGAFSGSNIYRIHIPGNTLNIKYRAFSQCYNLTYAAFGDTTAISPTGNINFGTEAFYNNSYEGASKLRRIVVCCQSVVLNNLSFCGLNRLKTCILNAQNIIIENETADPFCECDSIESPIFTSTQFVHMPRLYSGDYSVPAGIVSILPYAFSKCSSLQRVFFPASLRTIGREAFKQCSMLDTVIIPHTVTSLGIMAFYNCVQLKKFVIGNSITEVPSNLLYSCSTLKHIVIGNSVTNIGNNAFYSCPQLSEIHFLSSTPPTKGNNIVSWRSSTNQIDTYIPCGSNKQTWKSAWWQSYYNWLGEGDFEFSVTSCDNQLGTVTISTMPDCLEPKAVFSATAQNGSRFMRWSDGVTTNPRTINTVTSGTHLVAHFALIVHDTSYIDVPFPIYDTTIVTDTITLTEYVPVHDTTYINVHDTTYIDVFIYDTTVVTDTITLTEYLSVHDTTYIDVPFPIYDTTIVIDTVTLTEYVPVHDTTYINVHDTTYIDVPFAIHDTTVVRDTTYIDVPYAVHDTTIILDTTYIEVPFVVHDTTVLVDTLVVTNFIHDTGTVVVIDTVWLNKYVFDTIAVHDTTIIRDTTYIDVPYAVHDTTFLDVHDTTYIHLLVHDTTVVTDTVTVTEYVPIHDTTYVNIPVHDTTIIIDTVTLTEYVQVYDTTYITLTDTLTITQFDTIVNTIYDTITNTVYDTTDNYIYDTVTVTDTLWLTQYDTIMIHDTIIIQDTLVVGVNEVETVNAKIYTRNRQIVVEGADGNRVWLYDMNGRVLAIREDVHWGTPLQFDVPSSGTYMIKIGNHPARKVVVIGT